MKRYRVFPGDFDTRAIILAEEIKDEWDEGAKKHYRASKAQIRQELIAEYGARQSDQKAIDFIDFGPKPFSILAFHNKFAEQVRTAFVMGGYYPAATGAVALAERILTHLIHVVREEFQDRPEYKKVYTKGSFDNWELAIDTLQAWDVLLTETIEAFRKLWKLRWRVIHFDPLMDKNDRDLALEAIRLLMAIIKEQFPAFAAKPWLIANVPGEMYIKKDAETLPFVSKVYIPNCPYVGPDHVVLDLVPVDGHIQIQIQDNDSYENRVITDEEFVKLRNTTRGQ